MRGQRKDNTFSNGPATHIEFDDVVYQIAGDRLTVHLVNDHLLQIKTRVGSRERERDRGGGGVERVVHLVGAKKATVTEIKT